MTTVVEHLLELVRIPSPSSISNWGVVEYAERALRVAGWNTTLVPYADPSGVEKFNLVAAPPGEDPAQRVVDLVFMCHTDTVPYAADWQLAVLPFVEDGFLFGCGACDVKGFLACLLTAANECVDGSLTKGLRIVLTADEEVGCVGAHRLLASDIVQPQRLVIGEPTSLHPARAGKGYCLAEVTVFGAEAHSAHPLQGRSAIYGAARLVLEIEALGARLAERRDPFYDPAYTTINVGIIQGGTAKNIIPGRCSFLVEWRPLPSEKVSFVPDSITEIARRIQIEASGLRFEIELLRQQVGFATDPDSVLVRSLESLAGRGSIAIPFGSEASVFAPTTKEVVVFGPGDMRSAHSERECVPVAELLEAVRCIRILMRGGRVDHDVPVG